MGRWTGRRAVGYLDHFPSLPTYSVPARSMDERKLSVDSTVPSFGEEGEGESSLSIQRYRSNEPLQRTRGAISRAVSYLNRRRNFQQPALDSKTSSRRIWEDPNELQLRVDDLFASKLNVCSPSTLVKLRVMRAEISPIVIEESEGEDDDDVVNSKDNGVDTALNATVEVQKVQKRTLGSDNPGVTFTMRYISLTPASINDGLRIFRQDYQSSPFVYDAHAGSMVIYSV